MKVLLSSKHLSEKLFAPIYHDCHITKVEVLSDMVMLIHNNGAVVLNVRNIDHKGIALVSSVRFDWLYKIVSKIEEMPVVLEFSDGKCNLIISL